MEGVGIDASAGIPVGGEDGIGACVIFFENPRVPDDGGEIPLDGAGKGVFPIRPKQAEGRVHEVAGVGVAMQGLEGKFAEGMGGGGEALAQEGEGGGGEELLFLQGFQQGDAFSEDGEFGEFAGECSEDAVAAVEAFAYGGRVGFAWNGFDVLPEIHAVAEVLVRARRDIRMDGDDRRATFREETRDRDLAPEPLAALSRAVEIRDNARDEGSGKAKH